MAEARIESLEEHRSNIPRWWYLVPKVTCYTLPIFQTKSKGPLRLLRLKGWSVPGCTPTPPQALLPGKFPGCSGALTNRGVLSTGQVQHAIAFAGEARPRDVISGA